MGMSQCYLQAQQQQSPKKQVEISTRQSRTAIQGPVLNAMPQPAPDASSDKTDVS